MNFDRTRNHLARAAAGFWMAGDALTTSKQFLENQIDVLPHHANTLDTIGGGLALLSNVVLMSYGHRHSGVMATQIMATTAGVLLTIASGFSLPALVSTASLIGITIGCATSGLQSYRDAKKQKQELAEEKIAQFKENKRSILEKFPQLLPMLPSFTCNAAYTIGGMIKNSPLEVAVGAIWTMGSVCFALSKQTIKEKDTKPKPL